jgi:tetratricopeptide (TPR) repeat protein
MLRESDDSGHEGADSEQEPDREAAVAPGSTSDEQGLGAIHGWRLRLSRVAFQGQPAFVEERHGCYVDAMRGLGILSLALCAWLPSATAAAASSPPELAQAKRLYKAGQYPETERLLSEAAARYPKNAQVRYLLGLTALKLQRYALAEQALREAKRLDPEIRFTRREKFEEKLGRAERLAAVARPVVPAPTSPPSPAPPRPAPASPPSTVRETPASGGSSGPLWAYILLAVCGGFLAVSFVRERLRPVK